jgi:site-specific DNA-methyltransferase (cytosine-N4-specific)
VNFSPQTPGTPYLETQLGTIVHGDSRAHLQTVATDSINLVITSPPFGLVRKKEYGNADADKYLEWFRPFASQIHRILKENGSFVIDLGGAWNRGQPTRSLYHFELLIMLCKEFGFHLAQEFYWWNPAKLPSPAEWVTVRRIRVKDAINTVWWLSKSPWPKSSNRRILLPYSEAMMQLFDNGYVAKTRPSGHDISGNFGTDNGAAIPPNLLAIPNTESNSSYLQYCKAQRIKPHPARFPAALPEFFIRMLTDKGDAVLDPFAGSCVTGQVCERLNRHWTCIELEIEYLNGAQARFPTFAPSKQRAEPTTYRLWHPANLWGGQDTTPLADDGGRLRPPRVKRPQVNGTHHAEA